MLRLFLTSLALLTSHFWQTSLIAEEVKEQPIVAYQVMQYSDYKALTGCSAFSYQRSLKAALNFLVFSEYHDGGGEHFRFNRSLSYTHRHSRELFHFLSNNKHCQQPNLMRMAEELSLLDEQGKIIKNPNYQQLNNTKKILANIQQFYMPSTDKTPIFDILSRHDYIKTTGCLVSPSSYHKYHLAVFNAAVANFSNKFAKQQMAGFLSDVAAGAHNKKGEIAEKCLSKSVKTLAQKLGLLSN